ncbi:MAG: MFS transporter [Pantoea sp. Brub]|nr:MFS transporter [Pantoea sp. Brub]
MNKFNSRELRTIWTLSLIFSLRMLGMFSMLPALTTYGMKLNGANKVLIGIAIGIYGLMQSIFQIPFGLISDRIGRKPIILIGLILLTIGSIISATQHSIWAVIIGRALQGCGAISSVMIALLTDLIREQHLSKAMALIGINFAIAFAISIIVSPIITSILGINVLFWSIVLFSISSIIIMIFFVPKEHNQIINRETNFLKDSFYQVITNLKLIKLNISIFFLHALLMSIFITLPNKLEKIGLLPSDHWKVYLIIIFISFVIAIPFIILSEEKQCIKYTFITSILGILLSMILSLNLFNNFWILLIGIQIFFCAFNLLEALIPSLISKEAPIGYKGTAISCYSTSQFFGVACGSAISGWIFSKYGIQMVFLLGIICAIVWLLISLTIKEPLYLHSIRITLNESLLNIKDLEKYIKRQSGVSDVIIVLKEKSAYIKIDKKYFNKRNLEHMLLNLSSKQ